MDLVLSMKILFVLENYLPHIGGVEIVFQNLSEGLVRLGHNVSIVTYRLKGTKNFEIMKGVKIYRVNCFRSRYWFTFLSIPKVLKLAKKADLIHTTTYNGAFPARIASIFTKKHCIITVHEILGKNWQTFTGISWLSAKIHKILEKLVVGLRFDKFVSVSKSTEKTILATGVPKEKSVVVYNGVDYDFFNPKKYDGKKIRKKLGLDKKFIYFFYGRPGISKGLEFLIKAVPIISNQIKNSVLVAIVSRDPVYKKQYSRMLDLIKRLGIHDKIVVLDPVSRRKLPNYIKAADCVVVPSLTEGFGFAAAEACAMGKVVVASNTTSLPEVISGRYVLVKPRNPEAIAKGVEMVFKKEYIKSKLKKFWLKENINNYLKVYGELNG